MQCEGLGVSAAPPHPFLSPSPPLAAFAATKGGKLPLHCAAYRAPSGDQWEALQALCRAHPAAAAVAHTGNFNLLPLHYLCQESTRPFRVPLRSLALLLAAHPGAAGVRAGKEQELPLHCAVAGAGVTPRVLEALLQAHPAGAPSAAPEGC